jgi:hypothetical protein
VSADRHQPFLDLLTARMDGELDATGVAKLDDHLAACPSCRAVAHEYEVDRERMRAIRPAEPPRDLWARTSAALDREVADDQADVLGATFGGRRGRGQLRVAIGSFIAASLVLAIAGGELVPVAPPGLATATPFAIAAQSVNFVGYADGELTLYHADVSEVCPPRRLDCADGPDGEAVVRLAGVSARQMTMNQTGQLLISGRDDLGAEVFAIVTLPDTDPTAEPQPDPTPADPAATGVKGATDDPGATRDPALEPTDTPTEEPTDGPDVLPSVSPAGSDEPSPDAQITPPPSPTVAVATHQPILSGVIATGAAAAWSPDGTTLAFSAAPADRSLGSDVYLWRPGDDQAHAITDDHASLFASWSGDRVVISRADASADDGKITAETQVVDATTGEARSVDLDTGWLPSVDPTGRFVVFWHGRLVGRAGQVEPEDGRLYVADWRSLDPWRSKRSTRTEDGPATAASPAADEPDAGPTDPAATPADEADDATEAPASPSADDAAASDAVAEDGPTVAPDEGASDEPSEEATTAPATSTEPTAEDPSVEPAAPDAPFVLDRQRAVSGRTKDWVVRWSSDGRAFAVWTGEPGSVGRGSLIVRSAPTAAAPSGDILVDRVRAGRSFGLGLERIAWIAPLDDGEGELWLSVWGDGGEGAVKLRRLESLEAIPAY